MACVYLDAATDPDFREIAGLVLQAQNGTVTMSRSAPSCFVGDTAIKVALHADPGDPGSAVLDVSALLRPGHLTHAFVCRDRVSLPDAEAFWTVFRQTRDYVLSVARAGALDLAKVYVVKYYVGGGPRVRQGRRSKA